MTKRKTPPRPAARGERAYDPEWVQEARWRAALAKRARRRARNISQVAASWPPLRRTAR